MLGMAGEKQEKHVSESEDRRGYSHSKTAGDFHKVKSMSVHILNCWISRWESYKGNHRIYGDYEELDKKGCSSKGKTIFDIYSVR